MIESSPLDHLKISFRDALIAMDKPRCVILALDALESGVLDLIALYEQIIAPALNTLSDQASDKSLSIWQEHVRSSIVRSIVEACYPYLLRQLDRGGIHLDHGKVVIVSPTDEYHELGARMGADFFNLAGYQTLFVGANTPKHEMISGIAHELPDLVVINVVNYYNAFKVKTIVDEIKQAVSGVRILGSGYAFRHDPKTADLLGLHGIVNSMADIMALGGRQV